jgi:hypothetical protein
MQGPDGKGRAFGSGPDGAPQTVLDVNVQVPGSVDDIVVPVALNIDSLTFERAGEYSFSIEVEGHEEERLTFTVAQALATPGPAESGPPTTSAGYL